MNAARDSDENQYFVVKTEAGADSDPSIKLLRRTAQGVWSQYGVVRNDFEPRQTRPSLALDDQNGKLYVLTIGTREVVEVGVREGPQLLFDTLAPLLTESRVRSSMSAIRAWMGA